MESISNEAKEFRKNECQAITRPVFSDSQNRIRCPCECPTEQRKRLQQLAATEGVLLNALDVANILNSKFLIRNEEVRGSSPLTSTKFPRGDSGRLQADGFDAVFIRVRPFTQ
jgi:hypothetical protein